MSTELHDIKNILRRLEIMAELLAKQDFSSFSREEIQSDVAQDLQRLTELYQRLSSGR